MTAQLPDEYGPDGDDNSDEFNLDDLRVNFSTEEAGSEGRSFEAVPAGNYNVAITKVAVEKCGPKSKNPGKPMYNIQFKVQDGKYAGRVFFGRIMLFEGALYSLAQLEKALGWSQEQVESGQIIKPDELLGEELTIFVKKQLDTYKMDEARDAGDENPDKVFKNDIGSYMAKKEGAGTASGSGGSLMP